jgi:SOS response regulatory protein OraA/RecX
MNDSAPSFTSWGSDDETNVSTLVDKAYEVALVYISYSPRTRQQVIDKLTTKDFSPDIIEQTIARAENIRLIDDEAFAHGWVTSRKNSQGATRISNDLRQRGISQQLIDQALETCTAEERASAAQSVALAALGLSRFTGVTSFASLTSEGEEGEEGEEDDEGSDEQIPFATRRKALGKIVRRGFSYEEANTAIDTAWQSRR